MNPPPSKPTATNPMTAIAQSELGGRDICRASLLEADVKKEIVAPTKSDAPCEPIDTGFCECLLFRYDSNTSPERNSGFLFS
jgi:hypothetical protein